MGTELVAVPGFVQGQSMRLRRNEQQRASDFSNRILLIDRDSGLIDVNEP